MTACTQGQGRLCHAASVENATSVVSSPHNLHLPHHQKSCCAQVSPHISPCISIGLPLLTRCNFTVSGEAPTTPVASSKSGTVFEKRLIEAYIAEHGKDPVTGEELSSADLIELKCTSSSFLSPHSAPSSQSQSVQGRSSTTTHTHLYPIPPRDLPKRMGRPCTRNSHAAPAALADPTGALDSAVPT